jgi:excisionase family DNA binding protein
VEGAADVLGVSARLVQRLAREGKIPGTKIGRSWRFVRSALRDHVAGGADIDTLEKILKQYGAKRS